MKTSIFPSDAKHGRRLSPQPASITPILDDRVLVFQQFLMDRFSASIGVPPPSLYHAPTTRLLTEEFISHRAIQADKA